jgi:anti-anti-sigma factor
VAHTQEADTGMLPPSFVVKGTQLGETLNIVLEGELDAASASQVEAEIENAKRGCARLVLDLTDLTFIDSIGLGVLLAAKKLSREEGFELYVIPSRHECVTRVFALTETAKALA